MSLPIHDVIDWTDAEFDGAFRRAETIPLGDPWINAGGHAIDTARHELFNDAHWKGFLRRRAATSG